MTGRRLYEQFTDSAAAVTGWNDKTDLGAIGVPRRKMFTADNDSAVPPRAWAFLTPYDRRLWNDLAKRITPKRTSR
jgi:hypothetical protein